MRLGQNLSFQSQENFSKIQEQMSLFSTPKRFEDMNVRSSVKVTKLRSVRGYGLPRTPSVFVT